MATHSSTLAWRIPWMEDLAGYSPQGRKEMDMTEQLHFVFQTTDLGLFCGRLVKRPHWAFPLTEHDPVKAAAWDEGSGGSVRPHQTGAEGVCRHRGHPHASSRGGTESHTHREGLANSKAQDGACPALGRRKSEAARSGEGPPLCRAMPHCWARRWPPVSWAYLWESNRDKQVGDPWWTHQGPGGMDGKG